VPVVGFVIPASYDRPASTRAGLDVQRQIPLHLTMTSSVDANLAARLQARARELPGKAAFCSPAGVVTFAEFDRLASRVAGGLAELGIRRGDRVALMGGSSVDFLAGVYAGWKLGAVVVAVNAQLGPAEVTQQLVNSGPRVVLVDAGHCRSVVEQAVAGMASPPAVHELGAVTGGPVTAVALPPETDATIFYTSGTTGVPKGATHTHRALGLQLEQIARHFSITPDDEFISVLPVYLLSILVLGPVLSIHSGTTCRIMPRYDAVTFADHVREDGTTIVGACIPMMFADLLALPEEQRRAVDLSSIRIANCGGSPMPAEIRRAFEERFDFRFLHAYGGTEGPAVVSTDPIGADRKFDSVGVPMPHIRVVIEAEDGSELPPGEVGEITTSAHAEGPYAHLYEPIRCYWEMPEETAEALRGGRLHWGDLGYLDQDGFLFLVDRKKDMIIRGGMNVYPRELEAVLLSDPRVAFAAVVGAPHPRYGEVPWAFVQPASGVDLSERDVLELVNGQLATFKHLTGATVVADFPRNALGKILKRELRGRLAESSAAQR
jgi:acyl-CoA synthetase (AMP-forming)/AMP-acid ligase II